MIQVTNLSKGYAKQALFEEANFVINYGERIGLIGRNGHGKSTLFRILLGEEEPDTGNVSYPDYYRLGHLSQHLVFNKPTVLEEGCLGLPHNEDGIDLSYKVEAVLSGLGFSKEMFQASPLSLSGGYQIRLNLVKLLVSEPNLLLLDEPTNYLDIVSIRWLKRFLLAWEGELMLITHDRDFMNSVITHTMGIHRGRIRKIAGPTTKFVEQISQEEEIHEITRKNQLKRIEETEKFIERFRAKASKASAVQSRVKMLEKVERLEELDEIHSLRFQFNAAPFPGKWMMETKDICFGYHENDPLIQGLNIAVGRDDRIAVIGKNGKGKSTLLNLLSGNLEVDSGSITRSGNTKISYFGQTNVERLNVQNTIEEELMNIHPDHDRTVVRSICGAMMFPGDNALKKIAVLSGGEKSRVLLGKILINPGNLLLLDEPTNHLDMESAGALLEAVKTFPGAVIIVTHSEEMLREVATRLVVFDKGEVNVFEGTYDDFLRRVGWQDEESKGGEKVRADGLNKKELRRRRAQLVEERGKIVNPLKKKVEQLEAQIVTLEDQVKVGNETLIEKSKDGFGEEAAELSRTLRKQRDEIDRLFSELETASTALETHSKRFEQDLEALS